MNNRISVVLITDDSFVMPTCVTIVSLLNSKNADSSYDVYVVTPGLKAKQEKLLCSLAKDGDTVSIVKGDLEKFEKLHKDENSVAHLSASKAAMLKFDLPNLFPKLDKILYLDGDIIVRGDLSELFNTDLGDYYLAAAHDTGKMYSRAPMVLKFPGYFNSGMMLLNLTKMREIDATSQLMAAKAAMTGKSLMDQPAFNEVCDNHVLHVNSKWNYLAINLDRAGEKWNIGQLNDLLCSDYASKAAFEQDAVVIHYSSKDKPWKCHVGPWTDLWYKYYQVSPYATEKLPWQKGESLGCKIRHWFFSSSKEGYKRTYTVCGLKIRIGSGKLKRKMQYEDMLKRIEAMEREITVLRQHRNQLVRIPYATKKQPWQKGESLGCKIRHWFFSSSKEGYKRTYTVCGLKIRIGSGKLKRKMQYEDMLKRIEAMEREITVGSGKHKRKMQYEDMLKRTEAMEREITVLRQHRNQLVRISNMYRLPSINRDEIASKVENFTEYGLNQEPRETPLIVSLTSYPKRMYDIHLTLYSLLNQTCKPDVLVLWLAREQFPNGEADVPRKVLALKEHGLSIKWCEDLRSFKKLIPSLREWPDACIVTADDDLYYREDWLQELWSAYLKSDKNTIIAHRCHHVPLDSQGILPYKKWPKCISWREASFLNFQTNGGGVLYAPGILPPEASNVEQIRALAPSADDLWFWAMSVLAGKKVSIVDNPHEIIFVNPVREAGLNNDGTLYKTNSGGGGNDVQLANILNAYPEIIAKLR